jgi:hypothetical protein
MKKKVIVFLCVLIGILLLRYRDYYQFSMDDAGYVSEYKDADRENYQGLTASAGNVALKKGSYHLIIDAHSWGVTTILKL